MINAMPGNLARVRPSGTRNDVRLATRSRVASVGLVLVLLGVSGFVVWSSQATGIAAEHAITASGLSDDYARSAIAVGASESLERLYRLEPSPEVQQRFDAASADLASSLADIRRDGDAADRSLVDLALVQHREYLDAVSRQFDAVDRFDTAEASRIDLDEADPPFDKIEDAVIEAAEVKHQSALTELAHLRTLETMSRRSTPIVFLVGLLLAALLASITRGHRRLLSVERAATIHDSLHDSLTGLPNRTLLADRFRRALLADAGAGTSTGLLLVDLDRFKEINDTFGHHYGDELLIQVGARLSGEVRPVDTVARLGGDEFAILLTGVWSVDDVVAEATALRAALETPFRVEGVDLDVEASVGVVVSGTHGTDAATLLQRADIAMYVAKAQNLGVFAYDPAVDGYSPSKLALLGDLRRALDRGELELHYQPKVGITSGAVTGVEALVRWQHPDRGLVFPDEFIPLAEHTGLIGPLTRHVLDSALAQARAWSDAGRSLTVSVNLSARNLLDEDLTAHVAGLLTAHGVAPELLKLEVTETAIMTEPVRAREVLEQLSELGIRISIDDFGAGYTSLGQLKSLPVSELKIDRSFVTTMTEDASNTLIVRSIIDLGHNLGLTIVAEGVESKQSLDALAAFGCDVAQGYLFSRPVTAAAFDLWRAERSLTPRSAPSGAAGVRPGTEGRDAVWR